MTSSLRPSFGGFTLLELLVVMAICADVLVARLAALLRRCRSSKETALRTDLRSLREAIDRYKGARDRWPESLQALVDQRHIRAVPIDPMMDNAPDWVVFPHSEWNHCGHLRRQERRDRYPIRVEAQ